MALTFLKSRELPTVLGTTSSKRHAHGRRREAWCGTRASVDHRRDRQDAPDANTRGDSGINDAAIGERMGVDIGRRQRRIRALLVDAKTVVGNGPRASSEIQSLPTASNAGCREGGRQRRLSHLSSDGAV